VETRNVPPDGLEGDHHVELRIERQGVGVRADPAKAVGAVALGRIIERGLLPVDGHDIGGSLLADDMSAIARARGHIEHALSLAVPGGKPIARKVVSHEPPVVNVLDHAFASEARRPGLQFGGSGALGQPRLDDRVLHVGPLFAATKRG
jgi:hypothetical protein